MKHQIEAFLIQTFARYDVSLILTIDSPDQDDAPRIERVELPLQELRSRIDSAGLDESDAEALRVAAARLPNGLIAYPASSVALTDDQIERLLAR
jgi:hypothetical protein